MILLIYVYVSGHFVHKKRFVEVVMVFCLCSVVFHDKIVSI